MANYVMPYPGLNHGPERLRRLWAVRALDRRVALLEMTRHEFLDAGHRRQCTTFADGTRVTIDLEADRWEIEPPLDIPSGSTP